MSGSSAHYRAEELWRRYADDSEQSVQPPERFADDCRVGCEAALPIAMADHRHWIGSPSAIHVFGKGSADGGVHSQQRIVRA